MPSTVTLPPRPSFPATRHPLPSPSPTTKKLDKLTAFLTFPPPCAQLDFVDMTKKLEKLMRIEQKVSGLPEEAVPQTMARKLQPYVRKMQRVSGLGGHKGDGTGGWAKVTDEGMQSGEGVESTNIVNPRAVTTRPFYPHLLHTCCTQDGYDDRMHLFSFPPVLGVQSYFLDVPEMTGCCSIVQVYTQGKGEVGGGWGHPTEWEMGRK